MNFEPSIFELIERYHLGLLSEEETNAVELRIQSDAAFADYVKFNGFANEVVHSAGLDLLRTQMSADLAAMEQNRIRKNWLIGAGILLLLAAIVVSFLSARSNKTSQSNFQDDGLKIKTTGSININSDSTSSTIRSNPEVSSLKTLEDQATESTPLGLSDLKDEVDILTETPEGAKTVNTGEGLQEENENSEKSFHENIKQDCNLFFEAVVELACKGERNGSIVIESKNISGGTAPYSFRISESAQEFSNGTFSDLAKGHYTVTLTDSKACRYSKEISIYEKTCSASKNYSFNPEYGEKWELPVEEKTGTYTIYSRSGNIIKAGIFAAHTYIEWNGTNTNGLPVDAGVYMCTINYSEGKKELIELSVVR